MFDSDVDSLLNVAVAYFLVDDNANSGAGDVVDDASLAMVYFVGHAFLDGAVGFDIDDVTDSMRRLSAAVPESQIFKLRTCMV